MGAVIELCNRAQPTLDLPRKLNEMLSKLQTIDENDLLAALPYCDLARKNHLEALQLLSSLQDDLQSLLDDCLPDPGVAGIWLDGN